MKTLVAMFATVTLTGAIARAQPIPDVPIPPDNPQNPPPANPPPANPTPPNPTNPIPADKDTPIGPADPYPQPPPPKVHKLPEVLTTPTGWLLPNAMLYSKTSLDTGGGVSSDTRIGLGDVAEFGIGTTDAVRERQNNDDTTARRIQPYVMASFRIGVPESRLFMAQPGVTLGFRKSFERNRSNFKTRVAELTLVASKHLHERVAVHVGGAFWDASLTGNFEDDMSDEKVETSLHKFKDPFKKQVKAFGGIAVRPLDNSEILCYQCTSATANFDNAKIKLKPVLSWGVRTFIASWVRFEAGVRLPDIGEANLLDAQIFGQLTLTSGGFRSAIESLQ
jgi:hypothetical protein